MKLNLEMVYDPFDPAVQEDPYPTYEVLRTQCPVYRAERSNTWVLSRYADVEAALLDPGTYSSGKGVVPTPDGMQITEQLMPMMLMMDPPRHGELRSLVSRAFTARRVAAMAEKIQAVTDELLDPLMNSSDCDFVQDFAGPLPAMVIADLLGVPRADRDQFRAWSSTLVQSNPLQDLSGLDLAGPGVAAAASLYDYFSGFLADRRITPRDDLISALVQAEVNGERLTDEELLGFCLLLLVAGHETTSNLLGNSAVVLAEHPRARRRMAEEPALIGPAIEELLRYDSPVQGLSRTLTRDVTLHGQDMKAGESVLLLFGSANRDERAFPSAGRFDIDRRPDHQIAFGRGVHFCLGAALARMEARTALETILHHRRDWQIDHAAAIRLHSGPIRGYDSLPLTWSTKPADALVSSTRSISRGLHL